MISKKIPEDSFLFGLLAGAVLLAGTNFLLEKMLAVIVSSGYPVWYLQPPRLQLFILLAAILIFRYLIIVRKKENMAKGLLLVTFLTAVAYFYFHKATRG